MTFFSWKPSKENKIEPQQNFTGSYVKKCSCRVIWELFWELYKVLEYKDFNLPS